MIISARGVEKSFGNNKVLFDASINIFPGEVHALMGENGAGKSTLMNILSGTIDFNCGEILFDDKVVNPYLNPSPKISFIRQELNLVKDMRVYENIFLGKMNGIVVKRELYKSKTTWLFKKLNIDLDPNEIVRNLSIGEQQLVEITKGLVDECEVLIMDEPTAALSDNEIEKLFDIIKELKESNVAIVYISHRMKEIFEISDKITVMRDGVFINEHLTSNITNELLIAEMVGRKSISEDFVSNKGIGDIALSVNNISGSNGHFNNISFDVRVGEIVALAGLMGSRRTEILEAIFNVSKINSGEIKFYDKVISNTSVVNCIDNGLAFITEDRKHTGLLLDFSISYNIAIANKDLVSKNGIIDFKARNKLASYYIDKLNIKCDSPNQKVEALSGGNQQKVVLAKWLATKPKLLILDEPTRGIDIKSKREIYSLIKSVASEGVCVLLVSSEMPETILLADKIVVLNEGMQMGFIDNNNLSEEKLLSIMIGDNNEVKT